MSCLLSTRLPRLLEVLTCVMLQSIYRTRSSLVRLLVTLAVAVIVIVIIQIRLLRTPDTKIVLRNSLRNSDTRKHLLTRDRTTRPSSHASSRQPAVTNRERVRILYWTSLWSRRDWGYGPAMRRYCPNLTSKCEFTTNHSLYDTSDALLFHIRDRLPLPVRRRRPQNQKWIFGTREPPYKTYPKPYKFNGLFNLTLTYSQTSAISWEYGSYSLNPTGAHSTHDIHQNYAEGKIKMVAWFVSDCKPPSLRDAYVLDLQKHVPVDVYGKCGPYECPRSQYDRCYNEIMAKHYKFYLAFENSLCTDYVTEKLWNALQVYVVPVVLGGANYSALLPPRSYIDVKDFDSPKSLAKYLRKLDKDDALYNEYFRWKSKYTARFLKQMSGPVSCRICQHVYDNRHIEERIDDVRKYWSTASQCVPPDTYFKGKM